MVRLQSQLVNALTVLFLVIGAVAEEGTPLQLSPTMLEQINKNLPPVGGDLPANVGSIPATAPVVSDEDRQLLVSVKAFLSKHDPAKTSVKSPAMFEQLMAQYASQQQALNSNFPIKQGPINAAVKKSDPQPATSSTKMSFVAEAPVRATPAPEICADTGLKSASSAAPSIGAITGKSSAITSATSPAVLPSTSPLPVIFCNSTGCQTRQPKPKDATTPTTSPSGPVRRTSNSATVDLIPLGSQSRMVFGATVPSPTQAVPSSNATASSTVQSPAQVAPYLLSTTSPMNQLHAQAGSSAFTTYIKQSPEQALPSTASSVVNPTAPAGPTLASTTGNAESNRAIDFNSIHAQKDISSTIGPIAIPPPTQRSMFSSKLTTDDLLERRPIVPTNGSPEKIANRLPTLNAPVAIGGVNVPPADANSTPSSRQPTSMESIAVDEFGKPTNVTVPTVVKATVCTDIGCVEFASPMPSLPSASSPAPSTTPIVANAGMTSSPNKTTNNQTLAPTTTPIAASSQNTTVSGMATPTPLPGTAPQPSPNVTGLVEAIKPIIKEIHNMTSAPIENQGKRVPPFDSGRPTTQPVRGFSSSSESMSSNSDNGAKVPSRSSSKGIEQIDNQPTPALEKLVPNRGSLVPPFENENKLPFIDEIPELLKDELSPGLDEESSNDSPFPVSSDNGDTSKQIPSFQAPKERLPNNESQGSRPGSSSSSSPPQGFSPPSGTDNGVASSTSSSSSSGASSSKGPQNSQDSSTSLPDVGSQSSRSSSSSPSDSGSSSDAKAESSSRDSGSSSGIKSTSSSSDSRPSAGVPGISSSSSTTGSSSGSPRSPDSGISSGVPTTSPMSSTIGSSSGSPRSPDSGLSPGVSTISSSSPTPGSSSGSPRFPDSGISSGVPTTSPMSSTIGSSSGSPRSPDSGSSPGVPSITSSPSTTGSSSGSPRSSDSGLSHGVPMISSSSSRTGSSSGSPRSADSGSSSGIMAISSSSSKLASSSNGGSSSSSDNGSSFKGSSSSEDTDLIEFPSIIIVNDEAATDDTNTLTNQGDNSIANDKMTPDEGASKDSSLSSVSERAPYGKNLFKESKGPSPHSSGGAYSKRGSIGTTALPPRQQDSLIIPDENDIDRKDSPDQVQTVALPEASTAEDVVVFPSNADESPDQLIAPSSDAIEIVDDSAPSAASPSDSSTPGLPKAYSRTY